MAIVYDQDFIPEEEASINVDALVNEADFDTPPVIPQLGSHVLEQIRRATPTIPPGFVVPATPKVPVDQPRPLSRNASYSVTPALPVIPATPIRPVTPIRSKKDKQPANTPAAESTGIPTPNLVTPAAKAETPSKPGRKTSIAKTSSISEGKKKKCEDVTASPQKPGKPSVSEKVESASSEKVTPKGKIIGSKAQGVPSLASLNKSNRETSADAASLTSSPKRQHPGKLDIAAATKLSENEQPSTTNSMKSDAQPKNFRTVSLASTSSVPPSPAATSTGSPVKRSTAPRTLRVVPTPKTEAPPPLSAASIASVPHVPTVEKLRSRQASIASLNQPGTPASELISDNASITSTSVSRANSPPPIGGKAKKERQERARQIVEEQLAVDDHGKSEAEPVHAPIVGRKKKAKKPGASNPKPTPVPVKSQPASPKPATVEEDEEEQGPVPPPPSRKTHTRQTSVSSPRNQSSPGPDSASAWEHSKDKLQPTAQAIIADLQRTGELLASTLEFFKPLSSSLAHAARTAQSSTSTTAPDLKIHFSEADLDNLAKKKPVRLGGHDGKSDSRTLITPEGKFFWGLTQELEEKALELERHIAEYKGVARFHPRKQTSHSHNHNVATHAQSKDVLPAIATALKEAGAKLGKSVALAHSSGVDFQKGDPFSTSLPPVQAPNDPTAGLPLIDLTKPLNKHLDPSSPAQQPQPQPQTPADAIAYLNQFVLPKTDNPSPSTPRTEIAAVGGPPGAGVGSMSVNVNKIAKAAKAVAEGGTLGSELEGMGVMAADLLGGVVVQGLEALVGAGLGFHGTQDLSVDGQGNITLGGSGLDVQGLVNAIETGKGLGGFGTGMPSRGRGRRSVLSIDEAEQAMLAAKKDHEALEKKLAALMKRNKKLVS
ncbi:hypothetical protein BCR34DRAFT_626182 [Clohesyomyces aquaticus]|uniref:Uncharacterized protein n=1 Tax=Clohesyomyces aquaticus TaxID=1231657 RepID=A0A1Y1ZFA6_9PLEO|nr:hypothetical protein BCR34DRAFT_626182 [Clohesyomyces aquaticus]